MPLTQKNKIEIKQSIQSIYFKKLKSYDKNDITDLDTDLLDKVLDEYESARDALKKYMKIPLNQSNARLDRHKMAAVLLVSILYIKPIYSISQDSKSKKIVKNLNIYLGIHLGIVILSTFFKKDFPNDIPKRVSRAYFEEMRKLIAINQNLLANILYSGYNGIQSLFFLSHIFYWIDDERVRDKEHNHFDNN